MMVVTGGTKSALSHGAALSPDSDTVRVAYSGCSRLRVANSLRETGKKDI